MRVSILLSVYNGKRYVAHALESLLAQTYRDFELLVVDDGSTDGSAKILHELARRDARIRIITNEKNIGLARSLNRALGASQGEYVARMDADDVALPERLEKQVAFLDANPGVGIVGTAYRFINDAGEATGGKHPLTDSRPLKQALIRHNPFLHSSVMICKHLLNRVGGYDPSYHRAQDYDLWMRVVPLCELANLPEILMQKRFTTDMISYAREREQIRCALRVSYLSHDTVPCHHPSRDRCPIRPHPHLRPKDVCASARQGQC